MTLRSKFVLLALSSMLATSALAQSRDLGAQRFVLDNLGFRLTLSAPTMTADGSFTFPNPSTTSGTFIMSGPSLGQAISGPLSITSANSQMAVISAGPNDRTQIIGRDQVGGDFPLIVTAFNSGLTYGVTTLGRMIRFDQDAIGFVDMGVDQFGSFFVMPLNSTSHGLELTSTGNLNVANNITLGGTVDGVDIANADASNVKLTGNQVIFGTKSLFDPTVWMPQGNFLGADGSLVTPIASSINVGSDDATAANRTFDLVDGTFDGQMLLIRQEANASQLLDAGNARLNGDMDFGPGDTIMLTWNATLGAWLEISRSHN